MYLISKCLFQKLKFLMLCGLGTRMKTVIKTSETQTFAIACINNKRWFLSGTRYCKKTVWKTHFHYNNKFCFHYAKILTHAKHILSYYKIYVKSTKYLAEGSWWSKIKCIFIQFLWKFISFFCSYQLNTYNFASA